MCRRLKWMVPLIKSYIKAVEAGTMYPLECSSYMNDHRFLANSFLALNSVLNNQNILFFTQIN